MPYNYAFNNPIFFIDPDGMAPEGLRNSYGRSLDGAAVSYSGGTFSVVDDNGDVVQTETAATSENLDAAQGMVAKHNSTARAKNAFARIGAENQKMMENPLGGGCPRPCPDDMPPPVFDFESLEIGGGGRSSEPSSKGGWLVGINYSIALAGGFGFGFVGDENGEISTYFSASGLIGIGADISLVGGTISSTTSTGFVSENFSGTSSSYNVSFSTPIGGAGYETGGSIDRSLSARDKMSPSKFGDTEMSYKTKSGGYSLTRTGYGAGAYYSYSGTLTSKIK